MLLLTGVILVSSKKQQIHTIPEINKGTGNSQVPNTVDITTQSSNSVIEEQYQPEISEAPKNASGNQTTKGNNFKKTTNAIHASADSSDVSDKLIKDAGSDIKPPPNSPDSIMKIDLSKIANIKKTKPDSVKKAKSDTVYIIW